MSKELKNRELNNDEIDLGQLFNAIGRAFKSLFSFIGSIFIGVFDAFVWLILFVKKRIIVLALAVVVGFVAGYILDAIAEPVYRADTLVRQNYKTGETLNDLVNYLNELVAAKDSMALGNALNIESEQAAKLLGFELEQLTTANGQILGFAEFKKELDSITASTLELEDYVDNTRPFNNPDQIIIVRSEEQVPYNTIVEAIINRVASSRYFQNQRKKILDELNGREQAIQASLKKSDSLQKVYQEVLLKSVETQTGSQTSVTIDNTKDQSLTREYDLYNKDLELRRELVEIARSREDRDLIIEILSESSKVGVQEDGIEVFGRYLARSMAFGALLGLLVFIVLVFLEFLRFIEAYNIKKSNA